MAETSFIDAAIKKHENVIKYLEKRRGNTLNIDFVNNIMVTYDYNNGDWEDAMGYFTKYEAYMNEKFAFIPAFKLGEALRNLPLSAKRILAVKAIMRSVLQLHQSKEGVLDIVGRLAFGNRDIASMSKFKLDELLSNEFDAHCMHIEGWIDPRMNAIIRQHGGPKKDWETGNLRLTKAGRDDRLELWYKYFNQFPTVICKHVYAATADILPFEYIWACEEPDDAVIAYRKALEYLFGEICEDSFSFCRYSEKGSKGAQSQIRQDRTNSFNSMCKTDYFVSLGIPKNFREYLVKDPATWPTMRKMEVNKTNDGGTGAAECGENKLESLSEGLKRIHKEEAGGGRKRRRRY